jgi:CheY-like chemotaxis protein
MENGKETLAQDAPAKIMLVEDSQFQNNLYKLIFRTRLAREVQIIQAEDGVEAMKQLAANVDVTLIILDLNMPRMNGEEFLKEAAKLSYPGDAPPVIVVSTTALDERKGISWEGPLHHIKKPFKAEELCEKMNSFLTETNRGHPSLSDKQRFEKQSMGKFQ